MQHLSTAFVITALVIVVCQSGGVTAHDEDDLMAVETRHQAVSVVSGPDLKDFAPSSTAAPELNHSAPPIEIIHAKKIYGEPPRSHHGPPPKTKSVTLRHLASNKIYKVVSLYKNQGVNRYYVKAPAPPPSRLVYSASNGRPVIAKSPKFTVPIQTINGIPADVVRPPKFFNVTSTTTTTTTKPTTTTRALRTKRIWPKHLQEKMNALISNRSETANVTRNNISQKSEKDQNAAASRVVYVVENSVSPSPPPTPKPYRRVTRAPKPRPTPAQQPAENAPNPTDTKKYQPNEWVPIVPAHYPKCPGGKRLHKISKRSDHSYFPEDPEGLSPASNRKLLFVRPLGALPMASNQASIVEPIGRKKMVFFRKQHRLNPLLYSNINPKPVQVPSTYLMHDMQSDASQIGPKVVTKVKHHHHHHHHRYVQTVEKPVKVPYKVEVPKPYPVQVEKKVEVPVEKIKIVEKPVPYPVTIEKKVPVAMRIPYPVPVRVVEKEYVPRPYPVVHKVPVIKEIKVPQPVPVEVERRVPYPVQVQVPVQVEKRVPVPVTVEKKVPYPVPVKVLVPRPYPVEKKVPVPYGVKEPYEVIKHVPVRIPVPQPYPVKVPQPYPIPYERKVPYPVEVEKKVPVPIEILVPQKVEVEKRVPVYVPQPYPVEKKVPYPVNVPYPVQSSQYNLPVVVNNDLSDPYSIYKGYDDSLDGSISQPIKMNSPQQYFGTSGNAGSFGFSGFQSRADESRPDDATTESTPKP